MRATSPHLSLSILQLGFLLLHPLDKHLPHFILSLLQLHQELLTLGLIRLLQAAAARFKAKSSKEFPMSPAPPWWRLTWLVCTLVPCLWSPSPPVCSVGTARSGACASAPSGPPCWRRSASPSASQSHSGFHFPLTQIKRIQINLRHSLFQYLGLTATDWDTLIPWTTPQGYWRAFTILLPIQTSSVLPTTAKGKCPYKRRLQDKTRKYHSPQTRTDAGLFSSIKAVLLRLLTFMVVLTFATVSSSSGNW